MKAFFYEVHGKLFFHLEKESKADKGAAAFIFDGLATEGHKKEYASLLKEFEKQKMKTIDPDPKVPVDEPVVEVPKEPEAPVVDPVVPEPVVPEKEESPSIEELPPVPDNSTEIH